MKQRTVMWALTLLVASFTSAGYAAGGKVYVGAHLGMPTFLNIDIGYEKQHYGFKMAGMYSGNRETNDFWLNNGVHLDVYKNLKQSGLFGHKISVLCGYAEMKRSYSERWAYAALGYTFTWKFVYMQGGLGRTIVKSNYAIKGFFPFFSIGFFTKIFEF